MTKSASFDVIGTCFGFERVITTIESRLGSLLKTHNVDATSLFFSWFYAGQRDFTYLSLAESYTPIATVLTSTFMRACYTVEIPVGSVSDDDVAAIMTAFKSMDARPGLKACWDGLMAAGWEVGAVTNGGMATSLGYYHAAGIELDESGLLSCDDIKVAKPDLRVYENANRHLTSKGLGKERDGERWFVAAHAWDCIAARKAGFRTAYLTFEERDGVESVFGKFDVVAASMEELLEKLKAV